MLFNAASVLSATTGFQRLFDEAMHGANPSHAGWMEEVQSEGAAEEYIVGTGPGDMREWTGDRQEKPVPRFTVNIRNKTWENTLVIPREAFEDDNLGFYGSRVRMLGVSAMTHPDALLATLVNGGFTAQGYDQVAFFSASHPQDGGSTQSNLISGALSATTFNTAYERLLGFQDYFGKPIDVMSLGGELTLMVSASLRSTAAAIVEAVTGASGASNINFGKAKLQVNPRLTAGYWMLGVRGAPVAPFILQMRRKPELTAQDAPDSDAVFRRRQVVYGVDGRWNAGYGLWQLAVASTGS